MLILEATKNILFEVSDCNKRATYFFLPRNIAIYLQITFLVFAGR